MVLVRLDYSKSSLSSGIIIPENRWLTPFWKALDRLCKIKALPAPVLQRWLLASRWSSSKSYSRRVLLSRCPTKFFSPNMAVLTVMNESERKGVKVRVTSSPEGERETDTKFFLDWSLRYFICCYLRSYSYTIISEGDTDLSSPVWSVLFVILSAGFSITISSF